MLIFVVLLSVVRKGAKLWHRADVPSIMLCGRSVLEPRMDFRQRVRSQCELPEKPVGVIDECVCMRVDIILCFHGFAVLRAA